MGAETGGLAEIRGGHTGGLGDIRGAAGARTRRCTCAGVALQLRRCAFVLLLCCSGGPCCQHSPANTWLPSTRLPAAGGHTGGVSDIRGGCWGQCCMRSSNSMHCIWLPSTGAASPCLPDALHALSEGVDPADRCCLSPLTGTLPCVARRWRHWRTERPGRWARRGASACRVGNTAGNTAVPLPQPASAQGRCSSADEPFAAAGDARWTEPPCLYISSELC